MKSKKCPICGGELILDETKVLTSNPAKYELKCNTCNHIEYTTEPYHYNSTHNITGNVFQTPIMQQGWECPKCGAVMAPWNNCCVNCTGHKNITVTGTDSTPGYPYPLFPQTICKVEGKQIDGTTTI